MLAATASSFFTSGSANWIIVILTFISVVLVPILIILYRGAVKWTKTEDRLGVLIEDVKELVQDKGKVHAELLEQMRVDREATDRRLRYIEEFWMAQGRQAIYSGRREDYEFHGTGSRGSVEK